MAKTNNTAVAAVPAGYVPSLKKVYKEEIVAKLMKEFGYSTVMQCPKLVKITINEGVGDATGDKKLVEAAQQELSIITGQKAVVTHSRKDISNFKLRKGMPIGTKVTLRGVKMYEFLERLIRVSLPRIRDFNGISEKMDGKGNYTLGIKEQIIFLRLTSTRFQRFSEWRLHLLLQPILTRRHTHFSRHSDFLSRNITTNNRERDGKRINESPRS